MHNIQIVRFSLFFSTANNNKNCLFNLLVNAHHHHVLKWKKIAQNTWIVYLPTNNCCNSSCFVIHNVPSQVENYGLVPAGKHRKSLEHGSSIPTGKFSDFFRWFPTGSCWKAHEIDWNPPEKIQKISGWNTASTSGYFRCFPAGSGDFPASFLQDPAGSSGRNLRHG